MSKRNVFITGATGLIGRHLVDQLQKNEINNILVLARNRRKAEELFGNSVKIIEGSIEKKPEIKEDLHWIVHAAAPTSSKDFVEKPVQTVNTILNGMQNILELAKEKRVEKMVFLSTMEVYGYPQKGVKVREDTPSTIQSMDVRSSYPLSKMMAENLCIDYWKEYKVPTVVARLTQTFGKGVDKNDARIFAYIARCAANQEDIILKTEGKTERSYLDVEDASTAIITLLEKGRPGEAYNVASEETYCSIKDMAEEVANHYGINVKIEQEDITKNGFANTLYMNLDTQKIKELGWKPDKESLSQMYKELVQMFLH